MTSHEMPHRGPLRKAIALLGLLTVAVTPVYAQPTEEPGDPFVSLTRLRGNPVLVPPRALAVIPERHTGRAIRMVDQLTRIEPQFDDRARELGLSPERAIQLFTREASIPIYVAKTDASVSTVLQLELGAEIEVSGMLVERGGRYLFLASDVRASGTRRGNRR